MSITRALFLTTALLATTAAGGAAGFAAARSTGTSSSAAPVAATVSPLCADALARRQAADTAVLTFKPGGSPYDYVLFRQVKEEADARRAVAENDVRRYCA